MWKKILCVVAVCAVTVPAAAAAQKIVVFRGAYEKVLEQERVSESADLVAEEVAAVANGAEWEVVRRSDECSSKECLEKALAVYEADEAVSVSVRQTGVKYNLEIRFARRQDIEDEVLGTFSEATEKVGILVHEVLTEENQTEERPATDQDTQPNEPSGDQPSDETRDGLRPTAFWVSLGITGAVAIAYTAVDIATFRRWKDLEKTVPNDRKQSDWDSFHTLQITDRVLFGTMLAGIATSTVLFFLTDFKREPDDDEKEQGVSLLSPVLIDNGGLLMLQGRF